MLKIEEKEYDINLLCSFTFDFQMLKDVLINLVRTNKKFEKKIKKLEKINEDRNKRLMILEERLNIFTVPEENNFSDSETSENKEEKNTNEKKLKNEDNKENKEIKEKIKDNEIKEEKNESKNESKNEIIKYDEKEKEKENNITQENIMNTNASSERRKTLRDYEYRNSFAHQIPQVSHETIKSLLKLIRENSEKIGKLEKNITKKLKKDLNDLESAFDEFTQDSKKEHKSLNDKIRNINENFYDYNAKIDGLIVKTAPLDNLNIFRDSGNGNIDTTKTMIKFLEEKVNKRIAIIEDKTEKDKKNEEIFKNKLEELEKVINKINKEISSQDQNKKTELESMINENSEEIKSLKNSLNDKHSELLRLIDEISSKIKNGELIEEQFNELFNKMKSESKLDLPKIDENDGKKIEENKNNINNDNMTYFKKNIKALNNKLNDINNYFQTLFDNKDQDIAYIKKNIEEINLELDNKITKNDLKHLENKLAEHSDELTFLQDKDSELMEGYKKLADNKAGFAERIEMLTNNIIALKNREVKEVKSEPIDLSNYVDKEYLKEIIEPINKNISKLFLDNKVLSNLSEAINKINDNLIIYETKEKVLKIEEELLEKLEEYSADINKKFVEKTEFNKYIKNIDIKLKLLDKEQNKDADNWILGKQPIGCFNCASCEANINNPSPSQEFLPWNKYPKVERQYNFGHGFSRLLQKIDNKINKNQRNNEMKDLLSETEIKSSFCFNNIPTMKHSRSQFFFKFQNRETNKDNNLNDINLISPKKKILKNIPNKKEVSDIPLTDDENINSNRSMDHRNISFQPQIMKIKKKEKIDIFSYKIKPKGIFRNNNIMDITSNKSYNILERNQSLPFYDNI